jgi:hypothetical protein
MATPTSPKEAITMRTPQALQPTVTMETVKVHENRLILQAQVCLELSLPEQDADLPKRLEAGIERAGQMLKRRLFQHAIERADAELLLACRHGKQGQGIICRGTTSFTFKIVFGTVKVHRHRIEYRADGPTEVPSALDWQTPRQVALSPMLRQAACDGLLRDSAQQTVARIDTRAGESGVLAKTTVVEIVREEGQQLQAVAHARAAAVYARDPEALWLFVPATSREEEVAEPGGATGGEGEAEAEEGSASALIAFPGGPTNHPAVERDHAREVDPDVVLVELDEVKVHAQAHTGRKEVLAFTGVVMIAGRCWHLAAASGRELAYQVRALLAVLGVHRGTRRLLVLADGAKWIRECFKGLGLVGGTKIVCWWHLVKRCQQDLSRACRGREHRRAVESAVLEELWHGRVEAAIKVLRSRISEMRNVAVLEDLIGYLEVRRPTCRTTRRGSGRACGLRANARRSSTTGVSRRGVNTRGWSGPRWECWHWRCWRRRDATGSYPPNAAKPQPKRMSKNGVLLPEWGLLRPHSRGERHEDAVALRHQVYQPDRRRALLSRPGYLQGAFAHFLRVCP